MKHLNIHHSEKINSIILQKECKNPWKIARSHCICFPRFLSLTDEKDAQKQTARVRHDPPSPSASKTKRGTGVRQTTSGARAVGSGHIPAPESSIWWINRLISQDTV